MTEQYLLSGPEGRIILATIEGQDQTEIDQNVQRHKDAGINIICKLSELKSITGN